MRMIPWSDDVVKKILNYIDGAEHLRIMNWNKKLGFVAEALVEDYYHQPHCYDKPYGSDGGIDMYRNGHSVDIKADNCKIGFFNCGKSVFTIRDSYNEIPEVYLFVKIDYEHKKIALIGYLSACDVEIVGRPYLKGEYIKELYGTAANCDCKIVLQSDLEEIK